MKKTVLMISGLFVAVGILIGGIALVLIARGGGWRAETARTVKREYFPEETFDVIDADVAEFDVILEKSDEETAKVICEEYEDDPVEIYVREGVLTVRHERNRKWFVGWFRVNTSSPSVTVLLPAAEYREVTVKCSSGDVRVAESLTFGQCRVNTSSGDLSWKASVKGDAAFTTSSGDMEIKSGGFGGKVTILSQSGDLRIENVNVADAMELTVSSGDAKIEDVAVGGDTNLRTSSGDLTVEHCRLRSLTLHSSSGNVRLHTLNATNLSLRSSSGDVYAEKTALSGDFTADLESGDLHFDDFDAATLTVEIQSGNVRGTLSSPKVFDARSSSGRVDVPVSGEGGLCRITASSGNIVLSIVK